MKNWLSKNDTIAITGGNGGLGRELVGYFARAGYKVVSIDREYPTTENKFDSVEYYVCDISNFEALKECNECIKKALGTVTVLVNNAAIRNPMKLVVELTPEEIQRSNEVNLQAPLFAIRIFGPDMIKRRRGYIINIASALSFITPAGLTPYASSKAGLMAMHEGIEAEIRHLKDNAELDLRQLLVFPGQIDTSMFADTATPSQSLAPVLPPKKLAASICKSIERGQQGKLTAPIYVRFMPFLRALPNTFSRQFRVHTKIDRAWVDASKKKQIAELSDAT